MKVLLISKHAKTGGAAIATYRLMEALQDHSVDVSMLVQEGKGNAEGSNAEGSNAEGIHHTTGTVFKKLINLVRFIIERLVFLMYEKSSAIRFLFSLANTGEGITGNRYFREADIIHLHWINAGYLSLRSLKDILDSGKPVVWTFHDMWAFTGGCHYALDCKEFTRNCGNCPYLKKPHSGDLSHRIWKKKEKIFRKRKFVVVTPSNWLGECVQSSSLLRHCEVHTIHNPIDQSVFKPVEKKIACKNLGLDPGKNYILFGAANVGNMLKGFDYFVNAIQRLYKEMEGDDGVEIVLFGKSRDDITHLFPFKTHRISFTRSLRKIVDLYSAAHLFAIPSLQDNLPNTIVESLFCGTPVVAFNSGGIPEMIDHKVNGYLSKYRSGNDLAKGMKWVLTSDHYEELSANARRIAEERYSRDGSVEMHVELYRKLMEQQT